MRDIGCGDGDFVTIFAGVAGAADVAWAARDGHGGGLHEAEIARGRRQSGQHVCGFWALQREERRIGQRFQTHGLRQVAGDMRAVDLVARRVEDEAQCAVRAGFGGARHHQVVDDAAVCIEQLRVALLAGRDAGDVGGHQGFERVRDGLVTAVHRPQDGLAHVTDVEQPRLRARPEVFFDDSAGVLHGHFIASKRNYAGAEAHVLGIERRAFGLRRRGFAFGHGWLSGVKRKCAYESPLCRGT